MITILMGVPGAGKSTWLAREPHALVCSADAYFYTNGRYRFEASLLSRAHAVCLQGFVDALTRAAPRIAVDNTNTTIAEVAPYVALALAYRQVEQVEIVVLDCDVARAHARCVHDVPLRAVIDADRRLRDALHNWPKYWPPYRTVDASSEVTP